MSTSSSIVSLETVVTTPIPSIRCLFDYLRLSTGGSHIPHLIYPNRGILEAAAINNPSGQ